MSYTRDLGGAHKPHLAIVEFYVQAEQNNFKSEQEGHPVFEDKEMVRIVTPGDKNSVVEERVKDHHRREYARQYEAFKSGETLTVEGMPLKEWPPLSPAMVANLRAINIVTVEQLSQVDDGRLDNLGMGGRTLREKARLWLEQASGGAPLTRLQAENETLKAQQVVLERAVAELSAAVSRLRPSEAA
jgi:hypothetical protein